MIKTALLSSFVIICVSAYGGNIEKHFDMKITDIFGDWVKVFTTRGWR